MYIYNLGQAFHKVCAQHRDKTAIIFDGNERITFCELDELSNKMSYFLLANGLRERDVVAIQNRKSPIGFATMLACLKLGIIYTNFDYTNPMERIRKIFETASPNLVFADEYDGNIEKLSQELQIKYFAADENNGFPAMESDKSRQILVDATDTVSGNNPAYIMFTSGSTGIPKGVLVSQRSLLNFIAWGRETYHLTTDDIMTNVNPIYFDNSVFDFYCSVFNGITMVAISKPVVEKPKEMLEILAREKCTFWFSVPSMLIYLMNLKLLTAYPLKDIRIFSFGGEGYPKELLRKLYAQYKDTASFYNVYGPTEGTCICSAYKITEEDMAAEGLTPLGKIAPNFGYFILDAEGKETTFGELCLTGEQLALGYYNDLERTDESFVQCPGAGAYREKMYKTGDLVELVDGNLFFRGRTDNQIKHMGYRIELEEIENALIKLPSIKECAVVHTMSKNNLSKIVAYLAVDEEKEERDYKAELRQYVPNYMVPNSFIVLDVLPKNANGKIDRSRLKDSNG